MTLQRLWIGLGSLYGLMAVAMAALAAHAFPHSLGAAGQQMVRDAIQTQGWHALALLFTGLWAARGGLPAQLAGAAFALGAPLFCGAIYALVLAGLHLPLVAPIGATLLMLGWALLGLSVLRRPLA
jgi:uncharacterized membrane protein YgdD (TMEM256/DUF423 family)